MFRFWKHHAKAWNQILSAATSLYGAPRYSERSEAAYWLVNGKQVRLARHAATQSRSQSSLEIIVDPFSAGLPSEATESKVVVRGEDGIDLAIAALIH